MPSRVPKVIVTDADMRGPDWECSLDWNVAHRAAEMANGKIRRTADRVHDTAIALYGQHMKSGAYARGLNVERAMPELMGYGGHWTEYDWLVNAERAVVGHIELGHKVVSYNPESGRYEPTGAAVEGLHILRRAMQANGG